MALVICEVSEGARDAEATVMVRDWQGSREFMPVDRELVHRDGDKNYLPVHVVHVDEAKGLALIGLPCEADSGANRIWVKLANLQYVNGAAHDPVRS